jgi:Concanavalin A-like lectin/glucanases superfamily
MSHKAPLAYSCSFLAQLLLLLSIGTIVRAQSPIGHWEFHDGSGTTLSDSSGKGHPAVLFNGVTRGSGRVGAGLTANARLRQFVYIPPVDLSRTNAVTVAFWAKRTYSKAGGHVLFEASDNYNNSTEGFVFLPDDDMCQGIQIGLRGDVGYTASCYGQPSSQVWHHLAVVFDKSQTGGNAIAFYVDGKIQTATRSLAASTNTNNFGDEPIYLFSRGGTTQFDSGTIDDFRIYGNALPAAKVQQSYLSGLSQIGKDVVVYVDGAGTMTTPSFTTSSNGEFLVAFVASDGPASPGQTATVSGGGLTWTLRARSNKQWGTAEIWSATAPNAPFTAKVTSQPGSGGGYHGSLTVVGFTNASGIGKVGQASAPSGAPDISLVGIAAGNWVFAVGNDWDNPIARTPVSGQVLVHQRVDTQVGDTYWVQSTAAPSLVSGSVDIHDSAPTSDQWNYAAVEIVAKQVATYSISGTISGAGGPGATVNLTGASTASTTADSGGNFTFSGLANGSYTVTPIKTGYVYTPASQAVTVNGANVSAVNFGSTTAPTYTISGTITGVGGPAATVKLTGTGSASTTADSGGNYTFSGLANGSYTVTPSKTGYVYTPAGQAVTVNGANVSAVNFGSTTAPTYTMSGTISGAGGPGATVSLTGTATASTTADTNGNYTFSGLTNGSYTVTPSKTGYIYTPAGQAVTVNGANVSAVNFSSAVVSHWVGLSWTASTSQVVGYNAYRSTTSNGTYTKLNSALVTSTTYSDQNVQSGSTYYYVTTAVDSQGNESVYSNQAVATVP